MANLESKNPAVGLNAEIEIVQDDPVNPKFRADENSQVVSFVRFGLWESSVPMDPAFMKNQQLLNELSEKDNFIGSDSRRFYIRVRHTAMAGSGRVNVDWITTFKRFKKPSGVIDANGATTNRALSDDSPPRGDASITLIERSPGVFVSNALMLVVGDVDAGVLPRVVKNVSTNQMSENLTPHSGFAAPGFDSGPRQRTQSNFRIRQGSMFGFIEVQYPASVASGVDPGPVVRKQVPIFKRQPDERRRFEAQIVVLRNPVTNAPVISDIINPNSRFWTGQLRKAREIFERVGILFMTRDLQPLPPKAEIVQVPNRVTVPDTATILDFKVPPEVDLPNSPSEVNFLLSKVRNFLFGPLNPASVRPTDTIFVVYFPFGKNAGIGGGTVSDAVTALNSNDVSIQDQDVLLGHEMGHSLMNAGPGDHWEPPVDPINFINIRFPLTGNLMGFANNSDPGTVYEGVRIWNFKDKNGFNQVEQLAAGMRLIKPL